MSRALWILLGVAVLAALAGLRERMTPGGSRPRASGLLWLSLVLLLCVLGVLAVGELG